MKKIILILLSIVVIPFTSNAQYFSISEVDTSNFPEVSASFLALRADGNSYNDLSVEDFEITENGVYIPFDLYSLECGIPPISVVLVLDQSNSMNDFVEGEQKWQWVVDGVESFIDAIDLSDSVSKVALLGFGGKVYDRCRFTGDKQELLDSLSKTTALNAPTNFNEPFLDQTLGAIELLKKRPPQYRRVIVFLTDGEHSVPIPLRDNDIIERCKDFNIQTYAITLLDDMNPELNNIAEFTGGDYYQIMSKYELQRIYDLIARDAQGKFQCILSWPSELSCAEVSSFRTTDIKFLRHNKTAIKNYKAPSWSIVSVDRNKNLYDFGDPEIDQSVEQDVIITPKTYPFVINDIKLIPDDYFEVDWGNGYNKKFNGTMTINPGESKTFKVRFTQRNQKSYRQSTLVLNGEPCPQEIPLVGGKPALKITKPAEGKLFSTCNRIQIEWTGNDPGERINLYYRVNNGGWNLIQNNIGGNSYNWNPPQITGTVKLRATIASKSLYKWAISDGGSGDEDISTISIQSNDLYGVVCGNFNGETNIADSLLEIYGQSDIYLAKIDTEGNFLWAQSAGSAKNDYATAAVIDEVSNIYMTGTTHKGAKFDKIFPAMQYAHTPYIFLAHYLPGGGISKVTTFGSEGKYDQLEVYPVRMSYEFDFETIPKLVIEARYKGYYQHEDNNWILPSKDRFTTFYLVYDQNLKLLNVTTIKQDMNNIINNYDHDGQGNIYRTGDFTGSRNFGGYSVNSNGGSDFYITKYGQTETSFDDSDEFDIEVPSLRFISESYNLGSCLVGDTCQKVIEQYLYNDGNFPVVINNHNLSGANTNNFELISDLNNMTIQPDDTISIDVSFYPSGVGYRTADLNLNLECINPISIKMHAEGVCDAEYIEVIDFGSIYVGKKDTIIEKCIFKNPTSLEIDIEPIVRGDDWNNFRIYRSDNEEILPDQNGTITIFPDSCFEYLIEFTPDEKRIFTAYIDFRMPAGCQPVTTDLIGEGVDAELLADGIEWFDRRINSINDSSTAIVNFGTVSETITNIELENPDLNNIFVLNQTGNVNIPVDGENQFDLNLSFQPVDEIIYSTNIIVTIESKESPLIIPISGTGILPKLSTDYSCGEAINIGDTTNSSIVITNPSNSSPLAINRIYINSGNNEYSWSNGTEPQNIIIPINDSRIFDLDYTPVNGENHSAEIIIEADNYDGQYENQWKDNLLNIDCDAFDIIYNSPVEFNNILLCEDAVKSINITNNSLKTELVLFKDDFTITGTDSDNFSIELNTDVRITGDNSHSIPVLFTPDNLDQINYNAQLTINNSFDIPIIVQLTGIAQQIDISSNQNEYILKPGKDFMLPVNIDISALEQSSSVVVNRLQDLSITLNYDYSMLKYIEQTINTTLNNWQWNEPVELEPGKLQITGTGNLETPVSEKAFDLEFNVLLGINDSTEITGTINYDCAEDTKFLTSLKYEEFCFDEGRRIIPNQNYSANIIQKPDINRIDIEFFAALDAPTKIELYNSMGQMIQIIEDDYLTANSYTYSISTDLIPSGLYMVKIQSGPFAKTLSVIVIK